MTTIDIKKGSVMSGLTEGRIVHFVLSQQHADEINRRRMLGTDQSDSWIAGVQAHVGNPASAGDHVPMMVVKVWYNAENGSCNGQAFLDGNDSLWVTSVINDPAKTPGTWHWIEPA